MRIVWIAGLHTYSGDELSSFRCLENYFKFLLETGIEVIIPQAVIHPDILNCGITYSNYIDKNDIFLVSYTYFSNSNKSYYQEIYTYDNKKIFYDTDLISICNAKFGIRFTDNYEYIKKSDDVIISTEYEFPPAICQGRDPTDITDKFRFVGNITTGAANKLSKILSELNITDVIKYGTSGDFKIGINNKIRKKFAYQELLDFLNESAFGVHYFYDKDQFYTCKHVSLKIREYIEAGVPVLDEFLSDLTIQNITDCMTNRSENLLLHIDRFDYKKLGKKLLARITS